MRTGAAFGRGAFADETRPSAVMSDMADEAGEDCQPVRASRQIGVSAAEIFRVLADPACHVAIDGSGMLRGAAG